MHARQPTCCCCYGRYGFVRTSAFAFAFAFAFVSVRARRGRVPSCAHMICAHRMHRTAADSLRPSVRMRTSRAAAAHSSTLHLRAQRASAPTRRRESLLVRNDAKPDRNVRQAAADVRSPDQQRWMELHVRPEGRAAQTLRVHEPVPISCAARARWSRSIARWMGGISGSLPAAQPSERQRTDAPLRRPARPHQGLGRARTQVARAQVTLPAGRPFRLSR